jgi:MFS family permease
MASGWNLTNVGALPSALARHYGVALASIGLLTSVMFAAEIASTLPVGRLVDRRGAWQVGIGALAILIAANAVLTTLSQFGAAVAARSIVGAGAGAAFLTGSAYVHRLGGSALTQGLYGSVSMLSGGIALIVIPLVENALAWRAPFATAAVVCALALALLAAAPKARSVVTLQRPPLRTLMLDRRILRFGAVQSAAFGLGVVLSAWTVTILERRGGIHAAQAGFVDGLIFMIGIVGRPIGGLTLRRYPAHARALFALGMLCGAIGTMMIFIAQPLALAACGGCLVGLATGLPFGATMASLAREFPHAVGSAFAAVNIYAIGSVVVLTPLVGLTFSDGSSGVVGFTVVAVLWVLAAFAIPRRELLIGAPRAAGELG